jgi:hypothetical protein
MIVVRARSDDGGRVVKLSEADKGMGSTAGEHALIDLSIEPSQDRREKAEEQILQSGGTAGRSAGSAGSSQAGNGRIGISTAFR